MFKITNGFATNGASTTNGTFTNGTFTNGGTVASNGVATNGITANGTHFKISPGTKANCPHSHKLRVLHLFGSSTSLYYAQLSMAYAQQAVKALAGGTADRFEFLFARVHPRGDGNVVFDEDLSSTRVAIQLSSQFCQSSGLIWDCIIFACFVYRVRKVVVS